MESIGKLRELCAKWRKTSITPGRNSAADEVDAIADEIEREIAEKYMELPVDADGMPIHVGDELITGKAWAIADEAVFIERDFRAGLYRVEAFDACDQRHVKPRTIEDVLKEFGKAYTYVDGECPSTATLIADYADELRGMVVGE